MWVQGAALQAEAREYCPHRLQARELNPKWRDLKRPQLFILLPTLQFGQDFMGLASLCSVYGQQR